MIFHLFGARNPIGRAAHDARGIVLNHRRDSLQPRVAIVVGRGNVVLIANAKLSLARANDAFGCAVCRLDNLNIQVLVLKVALVFCHIDAGMISVGRVVETERDMRCRFRHRRARQRVGAIFAGIATAGGSQRRSTRRGSGYKGATRNLLRSKIKLSHFSLFLSARFQGMQMRSRMPTPPMRASESAEVMMMTANIRSYWNDLRTRVM